MTRLECSLVPKQIVVTATIVVTSYALKAGLKPSLDYSIEISKKSKSSFQPAGYLKV
jgi:ABC-type metal ion transport system substrate-binding protein